MGIAHFDEAPVRELELGHLRPRWTMIGQAAGCVKVGVRRLQLPAGGWSTPAHMHGRDEEIFYVLSGRGVSWQAGEAAAVRGGDCIVYRPKHGAHTLHAIEPLDALVFGERHDDESIGFPRLGLSLVGTRAVESLPYMVDGAPIQFVRESELGPPPLPDPLPSADAPRPATIANVEDVEAVTVERPRVVRTRRDLGRAAGSVGTGLQHVEVAPGKYSTAQHCHSVEEEIFVILGGDGVVVLDEEETAVRPGHVIARPPGTGVAHVFRAGADGLTYLAYGTRELADICFYPRSNKIAIRGLGLVARLERLGYWDGED
jgi:uncharacterized cupin superfamily protein